MSIIRGPRPARGFTIVSNEMLQRRDLSRRAKGLLAELLSHQDGWRTDSDSLAEAGPEGRDAIRTVLRELEQHGYLVRIRRQNAKGLWRTDSYVFDEPVPPGYDPVALLAGPDPEPDGLSTGPRTPDPIDGDEPEPLFDADAFPQVTPTTGNPSSVAPAPGKPTTGNPTVGSSGAQNKTKNKTPMAEVAGKPQDAGANPPNPPEVSAGPATASPGRPAGWDEWGPMQPYCPDHQFGTAAACGRCADYREKFEVADPKRRAARKRAADQAAFEADRAAYAHLPTPEERAEARRRAREALRGLQAAQEPPGPPEAPGAAAGASTEPAGGGVS